MQSSGPLFILGLFMASAITQETTQSTTLAKQFNNTTISMNSTEAKSYLNATTPTTIITITTNSTNATNTTTPSTAQSTKAGEKTDSISMSPATPESTTHQSSPSTSSTPVSHQTTVTFSTAKPKPNTTDSTGIVIAVVMILTAIVFGVVCYITRRRRRQYSVDPTYSPDEAQIPLSTVQPNVPVDATQNGMQTFESAETDTKELQEPEAKPAGEEQQKAEPDKAVVDPSADSAVSTPSPDSPADKAKEDTDEQSSAAAAPVEPSLENKTNNEGTISNNTSVETLKDPHGNNSNNADLTLNTARDLTSSSVSCEVSPDSPV